MEHGEIDVFECAQRGEEVPPAPAYHVRIDGEVFRIETQRPTGEFLLAKVHKRPCAFELIAEFVHQENEVIEAEEEIDLRKHGLKAFITAHKEIVTIFINPDPNDPGTRYKIERGKRTVAEILEKVGHTPEGYILLEEKDGPPMPIPPNVPVQIHGCEVFHTQAQSGGSS